MNYGIEIVIAAIILVLILFVAGYIMRKKYYKMIDQLEEKKIELMNRPVVDELAKVKNLNMTGQTEELFERWRQTWDDIIAIEFPNIDELLFNAEEHTDKYRFKQAKATHEQIEEKLWEIEKKIDQIVQELTELVISEEKNRTEIEELLEQYQHAKKYLLAHRHVFGIAIERLEELLASITDKITNYNELTNEGNYLEAREVVLQLAGEIGALTEKIEKIPDLLAECQSVLPAQIQELQDGYKEMVQQGFILEHLQMEKNIEEIESELSAYIAFLKATETKEVENGLTETKEKIDTLYDLLEKEVYAKHYIVQENGQTEELLEELKFVNTEIIHETEIVQNSYQLFDQDLETPKKFEKNLNQLTKRYELLNAKITDKLTAYSLLSEELQDVEQQLRSLQAQQKEYTERLQNLRKDELETREHVRVLQRKVKEIIRLVQKSHLPGLPADIESLYEQAEEQIADVYHSLNAKPLNMSSVKKYLAEATDTVDHLYKKTKEDIETAQLAERVIQYGNRYRRQHPKLRSDLEKAEQAFRNYEYMVALEQAATTVEEVEPGALKRIESMLKDDEIDD